MKNIVKGGLRLVEIVLGLTLLFLTLMVFVNVVLRYGFNSGLDISEELSRLLFVWLTFIAACLTCLEGGHVAFTAGVERLPRILRTAIKTFVAVATIYCCYLLTVSSWGHTKLNIGNILPVSGISTAWFFAAGIFGGVGMMIATVVNLVKLYAGKDAKAAEGEK